MSAQWTWGNGTTTALAATSATQLSDGALAVVLTQEGGGLPVWLIVISADRQSVVFSLRLDTLTAMSGYGAIVRADRSDNLYVVDRGISPANLAGLSLVKGTGYSWTPGAAAFNFSHNGASGANISGFDFWWSAGGGSGGAGWLIIGWADAGPVSGWSTVEAGKMLTAGGPVEAQHGTLDTHTFSMGMGNLAHPTLGSTAPVLLSSSGGVSTAYVMTLNTGTGVVTPTTGSAVGPATLRVLDSTYVAAIGATGAQLVAVSNATAAGSIATFPTLTGVNVSLGYGAFTDPTTAKVWMVRPSTTPGALVRFGFTRSGTTITWDTSAAAVDAGLKDSPAQGAIIVPPDPASYMVDVVCGFPTADKASAADFDVSGSVVNFGPPPAVPTLASPAYGSVLDAAAGFTVSWTPDPTNAQAAYCLQRRLAGVVSSWESWTGSVWSAAECWVTSATASVTFGSGNWLDASTLYEWRVRTRNAHLQASQAPFPWRLEGAASPSISPSITHTDQANPTIGGGVTPGTAGDVLSAYRIAVGPSGWNPATTTPSADSGWLAGPTVSWQIATLLAQGNWDAYIYLLESNGATNGTGTLASFTISYTALSTPTVVASTANDGVTGEPFNSLAVSWALGAMAGNVTVTVTRSDGQVLRSKPNVAASALGATVTDYEAGLGTSYTYTAQLSQVNANGTQLSASSAASGAVKLSDRRVWIHNPTDTTTGLSIGIRQMGASKRPISQGAFAGLGSDTETVVSDVRRKRTGSIVAYVPDFTTSAALLALLAAKPAPTLLIRRPSPDSNAGGMVLYFAVMGEAGEGPVDRPNTKERSVTFAFTEQGVP